MSKSKKVIAKSSVKTGGKQHVRCNTHSLVARAPPAKKDALKEGAKHLLEVCKVMNCFFPHSNAILGSMVDLQCFF